MMLFMSTILKSIIMFLMIALAVGFYTLMERKVLSYIQLRKGPNKVGFMGLPQPLADAAKLFTKENVKINTSSQLLYMMSPVMATLIMLTLWSLYTSTSVAVFMKLSMMMFLTISSLNVYAILLSGWASNSKYSLIGAIRAMAQTVSYEVSMALVIMTLLAVMYSFSFYELSFYQTYLWALLIISPIFIMWMTTALAETNRAPFDLAEGESELVSGFNVEYGSGEFALLFIAEYGSILLMSMFTSCMFMKGLFMSTGIASIIKMMMIAFIFLWVRGSYPRMRYDTLMSLTWKTFLTLVISFVSLLMPLMMI